jgi:hypothetical protein
MSDQTRDDTEIAASETEPQEVEVPHEAQPAGPPAGVSRRKSRGLKGGKAILLLGGAVVLLAGTYAALLDDDAPTSDARVASVQPAPSIQSIPSGEEESTQYKQLARADYAGQAEQAEQTEGAAAMPSLTLAEVAKEPPPAVRQSASSVPSVYSMPSAVPPSPPPVVYQSAPAERQLTSREEAATQEIARLMGTWSLQSHAVAVHERPEPAPPSGASATPGAGNADSVASAPDRVLIPAGDVHYAVLDMTAISAIPGPAVASLVSGPMAGGTLIGEVEFGDEGYVMLRFKELAFGEAVYQIDAMAFDPLSSKGALVGDVEHRFLERYGFRILGALAEGAGRVAQAAGSVVTIGTSGTVTESREDPSNEDILKGGYGRAGELVGQDLAKAGEVQPITTLPINTDLGIRFLKPVKDSNKQA